ncbi:SGNH/GDSL hydrolase family protein [Sediminicola luteus]|uniref:Acylhydrolase n=1 Tax=Sediminicola luteus TaxID=319238 RepID=A0A2A4G5W2_9FLAO|nr:SGNH/GDSL hydrolase family protein [Sediminicola luteus]PCE64037.1 acylhydrolase [Sediminicola luteus]
MKIFGFFSALLFGSMVQGQDWPNLNRFKEANDQLLLMPIPKDRVVFMGNSITEGWGNLDPDFFKGKPYVNRGISGQTTPQMLLRFRQDVVALKPAVVVILAGTNDIAGNTGPMSLTMIMDNLKSMTEMALANDIKVLICSVLPAYEYKWRPKIKPAQQIVDLNTMIRGYAEEKGIGYVDYFTALVDDRLGLPAKYSPDEVHPNQAGYRVMAPIIETAIAAQLAR